MTRYYEEADRMYRDAMGKMLAFGRKARDMRRRREDREQFSAKRRAYSHVASVAAVEYQSQIREVLRS